MTLRFRHLDVASDAPVETWPTEGVIAALERGGLSDWRRIADAVRGDPWGEVARRLEDALAASRPYGAAPLMERTLANARRDAEEQERAEVARRVRAWLDASGMSRGAFAEAIGTSASRLSTYLNGKVAPSSTLLVRMERVGSCQRPPDALGSPRPGGSPDATTVDLRRE